MGYHHASIPEGAAPLRFGPCGSSLGPSSCFPCLFSLGALRFFRGLLGLLWTVLQICRIPFPVSSQKEMGSISFTLPLGHHPLHWSGVWNWNFISSRALSVLLGSWV